MRERFDAARTAGFDGVEIQFPYAEPARALARAADAAGTPVILINGPASGPDHPFGCAGRPEMRDSFRGRLTQVCEYAAALRVRFVHILAGVCEAPGTLAPSMETYVENLLYAADVLGNLGVGVLIEPLNASDVPNYLLHTLDDAVQIIERCGGRVGLQFDAYHVSRMGLDPAVEWRRMSRWVRHVQFADAPGRNEPGTGGVGFAAFLAALDDTQYAGWLSAEYHPLTETSSSLDWLRSWRRQMRRE